MIEPEIKIPDRSKMSDETHRNIMCELVFVSGGCAGMVCSDCVYHIVNYYEYHKKDYIK